MLSSAAEEALVAKYAEERHDDDSNKYPHLSDIRHVLKTKHKLQTSNFTVSKICKAAGLGTKLKPKKPPIGKVDLPRQGTRIIPG